MRFFSDVATSRQFLATGEGSGWFCGEMFLVKVLYVVLVMLVRVVKLSSYLPVSRTVRSPLVTSACWLIVVVLARPYTQCWHFRSASCFLAAHKSSSAISYCFLPSFLLPISAPRLPTLSCTESKQWMKLSFHSEVSHCCTWLSVRAKQKELCEFPANLALFVQKSIFSVVWCL